MSHKLNGYLVTYSVYVDAHDEEEAINLAPEYLDVSNGPEDVILEDPSSMDCSDDTCLYDDPDEEEDV